MRVIVAGGRDFEAHDEEKMWLKSVLSEMNCTEILSGSAKGADAFGELVALEMGIPVTIYPANWEKYKRSAGIIRNKQMVENADALIVFPGGKGTANITSLAIKANLIVKYYSMDKDKEDVKKDEV